MIAMLLYVLVLGCFAVLFAASVSALKDAVRQRARLRGFAIALVIAVGSLVGMWAVLV